MVALPSERPFPLARVAGLAALALVAVEVVALHGSVGDALRAVASARPLWLLAAVAATLVSMAAFARTQRRMLAAAGARVSMPRMLGTVYATNAVNMTLPGGSALSVAYLVRRVRTWGVSGSAVAFTLVASGLLSSATFAALVLAAAVLSGHPGFGIIAALAGAALVWGGLVVVRAAGPRLLDGLLSRPGVARRPRAVAAIETVQRIVGDLGAVHPRRRDWVVGSAFAGLNWVADLACLVASSRAVDVPVTALPLLVAAYVAGMTASSVSFLPGGLGTVEVAMVLALTSGGLSTGSAAAAVGVYRLLSCVLVVGLGWLAWLGLSRT